MKLHQMHLQTLHFILMHMRINWRNSYPLPFIETNVISVMHRVHFIFSEISQASDLKAKTQVITLFINYTIYMHVIRYPVAKEPWNPLLIPLSILSDDDLPSITCIWLCRLNSIYLRYIFRQTRYKRVDLHKKVFRKLIDLHTIC